MNFSLQLTPSNIIVLIVALFIVGGLFIAVRKIVISILDIDTTIEKRISTNNMLLKEQTEQAEQDEKLEADKVYKSSTTTT